MDFGIGSRIATLIITQTATSHKIPSLMSQSSRVQLVWMLAFFSGPALAFFISFPKKRPFSSTSFLQMSTNTGKVFLPSQSVTYGDKKYRLCAAAAVLNSEGHLLVGERVSIANAWQSPQGGVDAACDENNHQEETIVQAASRELYEEMGLIVGDHVVCEENGSDEKECRTGIRYDTSGTSNWLTKAGFSGQELHWVIFRCIDGRGDANPNFCCDLSGQNGEHAEFKNVAWRSIEQVLQDMWPAKRGPYEALQPLLEKSQTGWQKQCKKANLEGTWERDGTLSENLVPALEARGLSTDKAQESADAPYKQTWTSAGKDGEWTVVTYADDGKTPRRTLLYSLGEWREEYCDKSTLFGDSPEAVPAILKRRTFYVPQRTSDNSTAVAHVTVTTTPKNDVEESRRYRDGKHFILKRTFWPKTYPRTGVVSTEVFRNCN